jgi:hypothetical protein
MVTRSRLIVRSVRTFVISRIVRCLFGARDGGVPGRAGCSAGVWPLPGREDRSQSPGAGDDAVRLRHCPIISMRIVLPVAREIRPKKRRHRPHAPEVGRMLWFPGCVSHYEGLRHWLRGGPELNGVCPLPPAIGGMRRIRFRVAASAVPSL